MLVNGPRAELAFTPPTTSVTIRFRTFVSLGNDRADVSLAQLTIRVVLPLASVNVHGLDEESMSVGFYVQRIEMWREKKRKIPGKSRCFHQCVIFHSDASTGFRSENESSLRLS